MIEAARMVVELEREVAACAAPVEIWGWQVVGGKKQKTAYEMVRCDWSSDVCSSDLLPLAHQHIP